jgi:hypothetical protein
MRLMDRVRYDLRGSALALTAPLISYIRTILKESDDEIPSNLNLKFSFDGEILTIEGAGEELTFAISGGDLIDALNELGGLDLDIEVKSGPALHMDANYIYNDDDDDETCDLGIVSVQVILPRGPISDEKMSSIERSVRGLLAHEFQHVAQRLIYGLDILQSDGFQEHMDDLDEIDARIEEIIAMEDDNQIVENRDLFQFKLTEYVEKYLERNGVSKGTPQFDVLRPLMILGHMNGYNEKFRGGNSDKQ